MFFAGKERRDFKHSNSKGKVIKNRWVKNWDNNNNLDFYSAFQDFHGERVPEPGGYYTELLAVWYVWVKPYIIWSLINWDFEPKNT